MLVKTRIEEDLKANPASWIARGTIYSDPPRCRCGECGKLIHLIDVDATCAGELTRLKWDYTSENGWVCDVCLPLPRLDRTEPNRPRVES